MDRSGSVGDSRSGGTAEHGCVKTADSTIRWNLVATPDKPWSSTVRYQNIDNPKLCAADDEIATLKTLTKTLRKVIEYLLQGVRFDDPKRREVAEILKNG
jgi:hypothetical protein